MTVTRMSRVIDLCGSRFGKLTVLFFSHISENQGAFWDCKCDCGNIKSISGINLRKGKTKSCGCIQKEWAKNHAIDSFTTHGQSKSGTYQSWKSMLDRCNNNDVDHVRLYKSKGITVCERWYSFENFYADMGDRPAGKSIDRIDRRGNYEPSNCKWSTQTEQIRNRSTTVMVTVDGKTLPLYDWQDISGVNGFTIKARLKMGWDAHKAVFYPVQIHHRSTG